MRQPERLHSLIGKNIIPGVGLRSAQGFELRSLLARIGHVRDLRFRFGCAYGHLRAPAPSWRCLRIGVSMRGDMPMAGLTGGLSFQRHLSPAIQFTETFPTPHEYFPLAATLLLSNSLADDVFDPPTSFSFRYAPPVGIFSIAELDAGVDVFLYILASLFEGCFREIVAQLS